MYGYDHEDDTSCKRDNEQAGDRALATAEAAAAIDNHAPSEVDVSHVILRDGRIVHVGQLPVVGVEQGRLVVRRH